MEKAKIRGNTIYYEDVNPNKKSTVLLVHGHPFNHTMWRYQHKTLSQFRLIIPDLIGYGKSDFKFERIHIEEHALDLALLLDRLSIEKAHLIGLSMGGQIIVEFCRLFPDRTESLIICASTPSAETQSSYKKRLQLAQEISIIGMKEHTESTIHNYINIDNYDKGSRAYRHLFEMMSATPDQGAIASHKGRAERRDNTDYLEKIDKPAMVIGAEKDYFFKIEDVRLVAIRINNSSFELIKDSGHLPNMEKPEIFNTLIAEFYDKFEKS